MLDRAQIDDVLRPHVESGDIPGLAWAIQRGDEIVRGEAGVASLSRRDPVRADSLFRISSTSKPITAAAALTLVADATLALDDPVARWLPELAEPKVLRRSAGPLDDTVPAARPITVADLLRFTSGYGFDFENPGEQAQIGELARLGLGVGPPQPATMPDPDTWIARLGTIPLDHQPGEGWRYHLGAEILGVLLARATGQPLFEVLRQRVLMPTGMGDASFFVEPERRGRFTTAYAGDVGSGTVFDEPDGQWASPPPFPSGGAGLVATVDDLLAFGRMLLTGGTGVGGPVLPAELVTAMTTDQIAHLPGGIDGEGHIGWGYGVDVQRPDPAAEAGRPAGSYGWVGGLGTVWTNDPSRETVGVLFTNQAMSSPEPLPVMVDFWTLMFS